MVNKQRPDPKRQALREQGALNRKADKVTDPLFQEDEFFDPHDVVQVKYEMLRRVHREGQKVSHACSAFGLSRPVFYQAQESLEREGLPGLVPKKRGPRRGHKLTPEVVAFVQRECKQDKTLPFSALAEKVRQRFGVKVHPRSIERVLGRSKKKPGGTK
jgi:transposase